MKKVKIVEKFTQGGIQFTQTRHGEVIEEKETECLVKLANFGNIITQWFPKAILLEDI